MNFTHNC